MYNKNGSDLAPVVNGCSSKGAIADSFKNSFQKNATPNNTENVERLNSKFASIYSEYVTEHEQTCNCKDTYIDLSVRIDSLLILKHETR